MDDGVASTIEFGRDNYESDDNRHPDTASDLASASKPDPSRSTAQDDNSDSTSRSYSRDCMKLRDDTFRSPAAAGGSPSPSLLLCRVRVRFPQPPLPSPAKNSSARISPPAKTSSTSSWPWWTFPARTLDHKPKLVELNGKPIPDSYIAGKRFAFMDSLSKPLHAPGQPPKILAPWC